MKLNEVATILGAECLSGNISASHVVQWAAASDLMSDVLTMIKPPDILLTGLSNIQLIRTASITGIVCVVITRNKQVDSSVIDAAKQENIVILKTSLSLFESCGLLFSRGVKSNFRNQ